VSLGDPHVGDPRDPPEPVPSESRGISFTEHLEPDEAEILSLPEFRAARQAARDARLAQERRERRAQRAEADRKKREWIEQGNETRQPEEYRGHVWDTPDRDGVHPTAFPPYRDEPQGSLSDAFIAFQNHNATRYETHPQYYCVECTIRYNTRDGGRCGPCIGAHEPPEIQPRRRLAHRPPPEYPI